MPLPLKRPCYESDKCNQQSELDNFLSNPSERLMLARNDFFLRLNEHRHSGLYCDICLVAEGQSFPAHRIVLHSIMPEWFGILQQWGEKGCKLDETICLDGVVSAVTVGTFLEFCYSSYLQLVKENAEGILKLLEYFRIGNQNLIKRCATFVASHNLSFENAIELHDMFQRLQLPKLCEKASECVKLNFDLVSVLDGFLKFGVNELYEIMNSNSLATTSEQNVYDAIIRWLSADLDQRRQYVMKLFTSIRMPFLSDEFLQNTVLQNPLIQDDEICKGMVAKAYTTSEFELANSNGISRKKFMLFPANGLSDEKHVVGFDCNSKMWGKYEIATNEWNKETFYGARSYKKFFPISNRSKISSNPLLSGYGMTVCGKRLYVLGGFFNKTKSSKLTDEIIPTEICHSLDLGTKSWNTIEQLPEPRTGFCCVNIGSTIYVCGGYGPSVKFLCFDTQKQIWSDKKSTNNRYIDLISSAAVVHNGSIYVIGGRRKPHSDRSYKCLTGTCSSSEVFRYDPRGPDKWFNMPPLTKHRIKLAATVFKGKIYVTGGYDFIGNPGNPNLELEALSTTEIFDPAANAWTQGPGLNVARYGHGLVSDGFSLYAIGGTYKMPETIEMLRPNDDQGWIMGRGTNAFQGELRVVTLQDTD